MQTRPPRPLLPSRILRAALLVTASLLGLSSFLGWRCQEPWSDPAHPPRGLARFLAPIETNAWMRLGAHGSGFLMAPSYSPKDPPRRSPIEDLEVVGEHVFVAFNDGTIVRGSARDDSAWRQTRLDVPRAPGPVSLAFLGDLEGYAVAGTGALFRTSNAGETWETVPTGEALPPLLAVDAYVAGAPVLWVLAEGEALWSRDGGRTWTRLPLEGGSPAPPGSESPQAQQGAQPRRAGDMRVNRPAANQMPVPTVELANLSNAPPVSNPDPSRDERRVRVPPGPFQVCATPGETWLISPGGTFTVSEEGGNVPRQPAVSPRLVRCARHRKDVVGLIDADGASWHRTSREESWRRFPDPPVSDLYLPEGDPEGFAVGPEGYTRGWGEDGPGARTFPWRRDLRRIGASGWPVEAWVLDADDSLWHADALGGPWRRAIAFRSSFTAAVEARSGLLLAATSAGMVLRSEDGGASFDVVAAFDRPVAALARTSSGRWAAIAPGRPPLRGWLEADAPGRPWEEVSLADEVFHAPHPDGSLTYSPINDLEAALAAGRLPLVPTSFADGKDLTALYVPRERDGTVWAVGRRGRIVRALPHSTLEGRSPSELAPDLRDIAVVGSRGWAVGDRGAVLRSPDGGRTWTGVLAPTRAALTSVLMMERGARVAVFGDGNAIHLTDDGGRNWHSPVNRIYPAPWCLLLCALALGLGVAGALVRVPAEVVSTHVEDLLATDAPITDERQDLLGQARLARTITYFLQNDRTEAPLTLAITGEWGSGKSSVLNMVRKSLSRAGMPVIRFNAWHHQQDADLLASLFSSIVNGAGARGLARIEFRLRLLARRWWKRAWTVAALGALFVVALGFQARAPQYARAAFGQVSLVLQCFFGADCPEPTASSGQPATGESSGAPASPAALVRSGQVHTFWGGGLATLLLAAPLLVRLIRSLRSFGVNPSALVNAVTGGLGGRASREQVAFRARFADEFDDVTHALGRRRLVLMIDDLDRCSPDNLLKVLEATDFLVCSGRCFVVLAMSRSVVLKNLAFQLRAAPAEGSPADAADRYLQKLINVEVALPPLTPAGGRSLLTRTEVPPDGPAERSLPSRAARWALLAGAVLGVGMLAYEAGAWLGTAVATADAPTYAEAPSEPPAVAKTRPPVPGAESATLAADRPGKRPPVLHPAVTAPVRLPEHWSVLVAAPPGASDWSALPWLLLAVSGLAVLAATSSPRPMTTDSRDFREALERWSDVIRLQQGTPRALKRFLNLLRFWAMRLRAEREPQAPVSPWQRLLFRGPRARRFEDGMSEPALVALAALHQARPEMVLRADGFAAAVGEVGTPAGDQDPGIILSTLSAELERTGRPNEEDRQRFVELLGGLQMRT